MPNSEGRILTPLRHGFATGEVLRDGKPVPYERLVSLRGDVGIAPYEGMGSFCGTGNS